jgi:hypothetical protein
MGCDSDATVADADAPFRFMDSIQHLEQQFPVASLPKKPQSILQRVGEAGGFEDDFSDMVNAGGCEGLLLSGLFSEL